MQFLRSLSYDIAHNLLSCLQKSPAAATELAARIETSIQNTRRHLENLVGADLAHVTDTRYSGKGHEMKIYAATPSTVCIGDDGGNHEAPAEAISTFLE